MDAASMDGRGRTAERVAQNDATFRQANEEIEAAATKLGFATVPFLCECAEESCTEVVMLDLSEYEVLRREPTHFMNVPGHEVAAGPHGRVVRVFDRYVVVEKLGKAAEMVTEFDTRHPT